MPICYVSLLQLAVLCQVIFIIFSSAVFLILSEIQEYFYSMGFAHFFFQIRTLTWSFSVNILISMGLI